MITIGQGDLLAEDVDAILFGRELVTLDTHALRKVKDCHNFLTDFSKEKIIYGINTGFGPMAQYRVKGAEQTALQYNLIRSHATGMGMPLSDLQVKSLMVARLNSLMKAKSGVHASLVELICSFINRGAYPVIYSHGGVGASGDLVQLAHFALALIGEGEIRYEGQLYKGQVVFDKLGLEPIKIHMREALALMNGTSAMTGIGIINLNFAKKLIDASLLMTGLLTELVQAYDDHFSEPLNKAKKHRGQLEIAESLRELLIGSQLIRTREEHLYEKKNEVAVFQDKVQEYYSIRCVPQILGPILDTYKYALGVVENELNSVNDNPVIDVERQNVYHGGNFHGDYVALEMDKLRIAIAKLSMLAERQLNFVVNPNLNGAFPPFANLGKLGLNYGIQGAQFTATSTTAENQMLSNPMYVHSIPNNNDNQDIVSMGTNSALMTFKVAENAFEVLSIECLGLLQIVDHMNCYGKLAPRTARFYDEIRALVPVIRDDRPLFRDINAIKHYLMGH